MKFYSVEIIILKILYIFLLLQNCLYHMLLSILEIILITLILWLILKKFSYLDLTLHFEVKYFSPMTMPFSSSNVSYVSMKYFNAWILILNEVLQFICYFPLTWVWNAFIYIFCQLFIHFYFLFIELTLLKFFNIKMKYFSFLIHFSNANNQLNLILIKIYNILNISLLLYNAFEAG